MTVETEVTPTAEPTQTPAAEVTPEVTPAVEPTTKVEEVKPEVEETSALAAAVDKDIAPPVVDEPAAVEPELYDLALGEDSVLSAEDLAEISKIAEDKKLNKDQAENLLTSYEAAYKKGQANNAQESKDLSSKHKAELLADPLFSSDESAKESFSQISRVVDAFGGDQKEQLVELLKGPAGNSLPLAKFLLNIAKAGADDTILQDNSNSKPGPTSKEERLRKLYPEQYKDAQ